MQSQKAADELVSHFQTLYARHAGLDSQIAAELRRPLPDQFKIQKLKRLRLKAKEKMELVLGLVQKSGDLSFCKSEKNSRLPQEEMQVSRLARRTLRFSSGLKGRQAIG